MGRFYFHLQADDQIVPDDEGVDLPDLSAAEHEAILAARELKSYQLSPPAGPTARRMVRGVPRRGAW